MTPTQRDTPAVPTTRHVVFSLKQCDQCWAMHESASLTRYCPACGSENHTVAIDNGEDARFIPPRTADDVLDEDYTYVDPQFVAAFREGWRAAELARSTPAEALDAGERIVAPCPHGRRWTHGEYCPECDAVVALRSTPAEALDVERLGPNDEWPAGISDGLSLSCSDCGEVPLFDYHVTEDFWRQWGDGPNVVCLPCLDLRCGGMGLAGAVKQITWTGTGHSVVTEPTRRIDYSAWRDADATG